MFHSHPAFFFILSCLCFGALQAQSHATPVNAEIYQISEAASGDFRNKNAYAILEKIFKQNPGLKQKLLDPHAIDASERWGYLDQAYLHEETMRHLIALQIKTMAELGAIDSSAEIIDPKYGIGSKAHKDKGTINNVFSVFGHPVRKHILDGSQASTLEVYTIFRTTIKNQLKAFLRSRNLQWHLQAPKAKSTEIIQYLEKHFPNRYAELTLRLREIGLELESLIQRTFQTNLLSFKFLGGGTSSVGFLDA